MATRPVGEKRGPKIGDAASLWNFTPSPGWTKEEAQVLKLCLMKFGIGKWVQILETGLLPGKLIQQLNGQTQRLLGQQSLAAYTGLQVDIDRIRADNEERQDAQRKAGLIINTGPNLTKEMKEKLQEEAKAKYGLTPEQIKEVEEQLDELKANAQATAGVTEEESALLAADPTSLSKEDKVALLKLLHSRLAHLQTTFTQHKEQQNAKPAAQPSSSDQENDVINAVAAPVAGGAVPKAINRNAKRKSAGSDAPAAAATTATGKGRGRGKKQQSDDSDVEMEEAAAAHNAVLNADLETLMAMGFSQRQAKDALEETDGSVEMAAEWLMTHCM